MREDYADGSSVTYSHDPKGNVIGVTPPGKTAHGFEYTPLDLTSRYLPPSIGAAFANTTYIYDGDRRLTEVDQPLGSAVRPQVDERVDTAFSYDGALITSAAWAGTIAGSVEFAYNNAFNLASESVNGADAISFTYDADGLLTGAGSLTINRDVDNGLIAGSALGNVTDGWTYNGFGEPIAYGAYFNNNELLNIQYQRDKLGRITQKTETVNGYADVYAYGYDLAGRLSDVTKNGTLTSHYDYDQNGNRLNNGAVYDAQDRMITYGSYSYTYTDNGELATRTDTSGTTEYGYDNYGNLTVVVLPGGKRIEYVIDGQNRRVGRKVGGTLMQGFIYENALRPVAELDGNGNIVARFMYGTRINVPEYMTKNNRTYRIITDHLGSPKMVVDVASGEIAQQMDYDEFGSVISDTNSGLQPFGFAGGLYDTDTNLIRFGARDYDPHTGRWTDKDPIGFRGGNNHYAYVGNEPVNRIDPRGLESMEENLKTFYTGQLPLTLANEPDTPMSDQTKIAVGAVLAMPVIALAGNEALIAAMMNPEVSNFVAEFISSYLPGDAPAPTFGGLAGAITERLVALISDFKPTEKNPKSLGCKK